MTINNQMRLPSLAALEVEDHANIPPPVRLIEGTGEAAYEEPPSKAAPFKCSWLGCGKSFKSLYGLKKHLSNTHVEPFEEPPNEPAASQRETAVQIKGCPLTCTICKTIFPDLRTVQEHMKVKHKEFQSLKCSLCEQTFEDYNLWSSHMPDHAGMSPHRCPIKDCDKTFLNIRPWRIHLESHKKLHPYKCPHCEKTFLRAKHLRMHEAVHS